MYTTIFKQQPKYTTFEYQTVKLIQTLGDALKTILHADKKLLVNMQGF